MAAVRFGDGGKPAEMVAATLAVPVATAQVVSRCASWSLTRPFPATLRRPRDIPVPPVAMTWYSLRLSIATSVVAILLAAGGQLGVVEAPVLVALLALLPAGLRWWRALRRHRDQRVRSRLATTVAGA